MRPRPVSVPVVMQTNAAESGAASLGMLLAYYGLWIPLEQLRDDCGVGREEPGMESLLLVAESRGLTIQTHPLTGDSLENIPVPCLLERRDGSCVVLRGVSRRHVWLNDPAVGALRSLKDQFLRSCGLQAVQFTPGSGFRVGGSPTAVSSFLRSRLHGSFAPFLFVLLSGLAAAAVGAVSPAFGRVFLDRILSRRNPEWLTSYLLILTAITAAGIAAALFQAVYLLKLKGKLAVVGNSTFFWHLLRLPISFFQQHLAGDLALRQNSNDDVADTIMGHLVPVALNLVTMALYLAVMLRYSIPLTAVGLCAMALNLVCARYVAKRQVNIARAQFRDVGKLESCTVSGIEMIETIKATGAENGFFSRWAGIQAGVNMSVVRLFKLKKFLAALAPFLQALSNVAILILGVTLILRGGFTAGMLLAFQGFLAAFLAPSATLLTASAKAEEMRAQMERIDDVMGTPEERSAHSADGSLDKLSGTVVLTDVTFGYSRLAPPLVEHFSLTLLPGKSVAFVGASGCGKSTLSKLISGLYEPWSGAITYDGKPRSAYSRTLFTSSLAVVDQDIVLFEDTVANNLRMWDTTIEDFDLIMAARDAHIHEDIMQRDGGYDAPVLESGRNFSGGQRQRLEIARVLAQDPTILIMDEATSALDAKTEYEVVNSIKARGISCIVIAHRLSTIRDCDEIIVLDKGHVVERGTHEMLCTLHGRYAALLSNE